MPRLTVPFEISEQCISLPKDESRYLNNVLRLKKGAQLTVIDSTGARFEAGVHSVKPTHVTLGILKKLGRPEEPAFGIVLVQGILKGANMDLVVQKATELGVRGIAPVVTERTQVHDTRKAPRWRRIASEAARQCGRPGVPWIGEPVGFAEYLGSAELSGYIFYEAAGDEGRAAPSACHDRDIVAAIGPEGGFTSGEVALANERGLVTAGLGPNILRAETAAIAAVALLTLRG